MLAELCGREIRREKVESAIEGGGLALKVPSVLILLRLTLPFIPSSLSFSLSLFLPFLVIHHRIRPERVVLCCARVSVECSNEFASCFIALVPLTLQQAVSGQAYPEIKRFIHVLEVVSIRKTFIGAPLLSDLICSY